MPAEMDKYFELGYKSSKFSQLGDSIKSVIQRYNDQNQLESGLAAKAGMERIFQDPLEQEYKQSQIKNLKASAGAYNRMGSETEDEVYRDPSTGEEVPKETALGLISQGKQFIINRKQPTRYGFTEQSISKPEDLSQEEKQYVTTSDRVLSSLDSLKDIYGRLDEMGGNKDWQALQAQNSPFALIGNQNIQDYKSSLTQLKSDIPFLRGGKQLTATEAKRVDILLNPFGKSSETRSKDIERFKKEFIGGRALTTRGIRELNERTMNNPFKKSDTPTFNTPEEAEMSGYKGEAIIGGKRARID